MNKKRWLIANCNKIFFIHLFNFKFSECQVFERWYYEALESMNSILLEAVWKALFVYFYHARLTQACGVMAQLMLSATLWARSVELLTRMLRIHFLEMKWCHWRKLDKSMGIWRTPQVLPIFFYVHLFNYVISISFLGAEMIPSVFTNPSF